jgi:prolipoprotein diacylglyceryl transferase
VSLATLPATIAALGPDGVVLGSIPSPSSNRLGPLHMYGLMIALGVIAAVEAGRIRWRNRGGNPDDVYAIAFWAVPAGLVGARIYHVVTDWNRLYSGGRWWPEAFKVWNGGLGIPGGVALGVAVGVWVAHRRGWRLGVGLDALIPGIALAQAIGRLGNWWNQELFGGPTSLPWGVEIDLKNRPLEYAGSATFHPTFLYEMLWNLALFGLLIWVDRGRRLRPGTMLPLYVGGYFLGRLWIEAMRIDTATEILGIRVNIWLSIVGIGGAVVAVVARGLWRRPDDSDEPYRDGHRWSDPRNTGAAHEDPTGGDDTGSESVPDRPAQHAPDALEESDGRGADEVVGVSDEPTEDPPPT